MRAELLHTFVADPRSATVVEILDDGALMTGGGDGHLRRWDATHWIELAEIDAHGKGVRDLCLAGDRALSAGGDRTLRAWRIADGKPLYAISRRIAARAGDGFVAAISSRGRICLHDLATGAETLRLPRLDERVDCLAIAPGGGGLVAGASDGPWRVSLDGRAIERCPGDLGAIRAIDADDRGAWAVDERAAVACWSADGDLRWRVEADGALPGAVRVSPDGGRIALSMAYLIQVRDTADGRLCGEIKTRLKGMFGLAWSADGRRLACAAADGRVRVWTIG